MKNAPILKIFSYLPNPRVFKALIAAELGGAEISVVGAKPAELAHWLWDVDARPLEESERTADSPHAREGRRGFSGRLYKTNAFLAAHPFGTVPAAFSPDGAVGVFESNSILRAVARNVPAANLYGGNAYEAARIDGFLDANLVFAREAQVYLLALQRPDAATYKRMQQAYEFYLHGIEQALGADDFIAGATITIADISFVCDLAQFLREGHYREQLEAAGLSLISANALHDYPRALGHMLKLGEEPAFTKHMQGYLDWYKREHGLAGS